VGHNNPDKYMKKKKNPKYKGFHLIDKTAGVILNGIWIKDDGSELIIESSFWGDKNLHFKPLKSNEISL